jgi:flagellar basal body-associated protein FliL
MTVTLNPQIMRSVEQLDYAVTIGDVATQAGLELNVTQQGLLALASEAGGHLQVTDSGDILYQFPKNFRTILRNRFWRLRLQELWQKIWGALFYLIRISFGVILIISIIVMFLAIVAILIAVNSKDSDSNSGGDRDGGGFFFFPTDIFWIFNPSPDYNRYESRAGQGKSSSARSMNFLEAIFSFLFGDGNPNEDLEEKRWQTIGTLIRNQGGAIAAEQVAPYLDNVTSINQETEDYILPVLARFNGYPQVSDQGDLIYYFPELQVTAKKRTLTAISSYLNEKRWQFSQADSGQIMLSLGLGTVNIVLALMLGGLLRQYGAGIAIASLIQPVYGVLLIYAIAFLAIPLGRYFWLQWRNQGIDSRNQKRQAKAEWLTLPNPKFRQKLQFAEDFAAEKVITAADITYRTDEDLLVQEAEQSDKIDQEWQRRLESRS